MESRFWAADSLSEAPVDPLSGLQRPHEAPPLDLVPFEKYTDLAILSNHVKPEFFEPSSEKTTQKYIPK